MIRIRPAASLAALALVAGCAAPLPPPYAYTGENAARLTIQNRSIVGVTLTAHDDGARCTGGAAIDTAVPNAQTRSLLPKGSAVTLSVPPGKEWAVHLVSERIGELARDGLAQSKQCSVIGSFVPAAGQPYRAVFDMKDGICLFAVYALKAGPGGAQVDEREPSERLRSTVVRNASRGGGICE